MLFSYNWLKDYIKKLPKPEKLAQLLTMHSFEVEEVKKVGRDYILNIDVLPNRGPDCFSHIGIAREIVAILAPKTKFLKSFPPSRPAKAGARRAQAPRFKKFVFFAKNIKDDCNRYSAKVMIDVKVSSSPKWLQERLRTCGLRPINNIVDIANYVMLETGQPLHAFDFDKIEAAPAGGQGAKLFVRRAKKGEMITTLDNEQYRLDKDILVIADQKSPLAIAGIKGGKKAEIDKKTKTVVLESANFNPGVIRRASKKLNLRTDASLRFEHKIDPNLTETTINRAAELIEQQAGAKIASGLVDFYPKKVLSKKIKLDLNYVERLLGVKISAREIKNILERLGFGYVDNIVEVPTWRLDISLAEDLVEEIGRLYGYQKIPAVFPVVSLIPPKKNLELFWEDSAKNILKELGFIELYNYSFIGDKEAKIFGYLPCPPGRRALGKELVELENPMSLEQKYLRPSLIPNLLKNLVANLRFFSDIKIFELGRIFIKGEKRMLTGATFDSFYRAKGMVDTFLNKLGVSSVWYDEHRPSPEESKICLWYIGRCAEIKIDNKEIGFLGELSSKILKELKIDKKVVIFDIDFEALSKLCSEECEYQPLSQYPAAVRDIAVLVPLDIKVVDVLNKINSSGGPLIRDVDLFDIYEGENIPQGKKNLAFHIVYQAEDRTLRPKEIEALQEKIIKALEENPQWEVRR